MEGGEEPIRRARGERVLSPPFSPRFSLSVPLCLCLTLCSTLLATAETEAGAAVAGGGAGGGAPAASEGAGQCGDPGGPSGTAPACAFGSSAHDAGATVGGLSGGVREGGGQGVQGEVGKEEAWGQQGGEEWEGEWGSKREKGDWEEEEEEEGEEALEQEWAALGRKGPRDPGAGGADTGAAEGAPGAAHIEEEEYEEDEASLAGLGQWMTEQGAEGGTTDYSAIRVVIVVGSRTCSAMQQILEGNQDVPQSLKDLNKWSTGASMKLVAARNVRKGEQLASVPWSVVVQPSGVLSLWEQASEIAKGSESAFSELQPHTLLALWLLGEQAKGGDSPWAPFISALPTYVPLPLFFTPEVRGELQYRPMEVQIHLQQQHLDSELLLAREAAASAGLEVGEVTRERFLWAVSIVLSRSLALPARGGPAAQGLAGDEGNEGDGPREKKDGEGGEEVGDIGAREARGGPGARGLAGDEGSEGEVRGEQEDGEGDEAVGDRGAGEAVPVPTSPSLVPLLDLLSHEFGLATCTLHASEDALVLLAARDLKEGEDLTLRRGPQSADEALLSLGQLPPGVGPADAVPVLSSPAFLVTRFLHFAGIARGSTPLPELTGNLKGRWAEAQALNRKTGGVPFLDELVEEAQGIVAEAERAVKEAKGSLFASKDKALGAGRGWGAGTPSTALDLQGYSLWAAGARVDPELLAALGALSLHALGNAEGKPLDYALLGRASVLLGWGVLGASCSDILGSLRGAARGGATGIPGGSRRERALRRYLLGGEPAVHRGEGVGEERGRRGDPALEPGLEVEGAPVRGLQYAALAMHSIVGNALRALPTALEDDLNILAMLSHCSLLVQSLRHAKSMPDNVLEQCNIGLMAQLPEVTTVTRFRVRKKRILKAVLSRLAAQCTDAHATEEEGGGTGTPGGTSQVVRTVSLGEREEARAIANKSEIQLVQEMVDWLRKKGGVTGLPVVVATTSTGPRDPPAVEVRIHQQASTDSSCCPGAEAQSAKECKQQPCAASRRPLGLFAGRDIEEGEVLLSLPRSAWITTSPLADSRLPYPGVQHGYSLMAAYLLREKAKGNASVWAPYLRVLPPRVPTHPAVFPSHILNETQDSGLVYAVEQNKRFVELDYKRCIPASIGYASRAQHQWAHLMVQTRAFSNPQPLPVPKGDLDVDSADGEEAGDAGWRGGEGASGGALAYIGDNGQLVPFADLLDHSPYWNVIYKTDSEQRVFEMVAQTRIPKGAPLYDSYGDRSNANLLLNYGFFLEDNRWDSVTLFEDVQSILRSLEASSSGASSPEGDVTLGDSGGEHNDTVGSSEQGSGGSWGKADAASGAKAESGSEEAGAGDSGGAAPVIPRHTGRGPLSLGAEALAEVAANASEAARAVFLVIEGVPKVAVLRRQADLQLGRKLSPDEMLNAHAGGYLDHALVAILMALHSLQQAPAREVPYDRLAKVAVQVAWKVPNRDCDVIEEYLEDPIDMKAAEMAGDTIRGRAEGLLAEHPTTLDEDDAILEALQGCTGNAPGEGGAQLPGGAQGFCERYPTPESRLQYETAVRYRRIRKTRLQEAAGCCRWACS